MHAGASNVVAKVRRRLRLSWGLGDSDYGYRPRASVRHAQLGKCQRL